MEDFKGPGFQSNKTINQKETIVRTDIKKRTTTTKQNKKFD